MSVFGCHEQLKHQLLYSLIDLIPAAFVAVLGLKLLNELIKVNLGQLSAIVHNCEVRFVDLSGSVVVGELVVRQSNPKHLVDVHFHRIQLFIQKENDKSN